MRTKFDFSEVETSGLILALKVCEDNLHTINASRSMQIVLQFMSKKITKEHYKINPLMR